jgi:hypothetical protein
MAKPGFASSLSIDSFSFALRSELLDCALCVTGAGGGIEDDVPGAKIEFLGENKALFWKAS